MAIPSPNQRPLLPSPGQAPSQQTPVSFTNDQIHALRAQIHAFNLISRGQTVSESVQHAIRVPNTAVADLEKDDAAVKTAKGEPGTPTVTATMLREGAIKPQEMDFPPLDSADYPKGPSSRTTLTQGFTLQCLQAPFLSPQTPFRHGSSAPWNSSPTPYHPHHHASGS
jgi:ATP-dependent helicase STH1/SNF2